MGLPLFVVHVEPEMTSKAVEKATSGPRSSIRRQRTVRGPQARVVESRLQDRLVANNDSEHRAASESLVRLHYRANRLIEDERARLRDRRPIIIDDEHAESEDSSSFLPPVPESRDYVTNAERRLQRLYQVREESRRAARAHPAPTPPYTMTDLAFIARMSESPRPSSFTAALSPLRQIDGESGPTHDDGDFDTTLRNRPPYPGRSTLTESLQNMNRASQRSLERQRRRLRQARLDGLGDRDRSLSPENGGAWETLLTSITPDPQPPSVGSSFASASASASAAAASSSSSGPASATTSMTSLSGEDPALHDCDPSTTSSNTDNEDDDIYELRPLQRMGGERLWRTYADVAGPPGDNQTRNASPGDPESLLSMHRIIAGLAERDDIPDEWWAGAGLSRSLPREPAS